jgi:hypothetical protein
MTYKPKFFVPTADLKVKIKQKIEVQPIDFTILSHLKTEDLNAELKLLDACIAAFPREFVRNLVCLNPERLIEHEILAQLQANIKLDRNVDDEADTFGQAFTWVQELLISNSADIQLKKDGDGIFLRTKNEVSEFIEALANDITIESTSFTPNQTRQVIELYNEISIKEPWNNDKQLLKSVCEQRAMAIIYTQRAQELIQAVVKQHIDELCEQQKLQPLNFVGKEVGVAIFTTGGVASGKGTCLKNIEATLLERQPTAVQWNELVHHNADRLKPFLLNPEVDPLKYSQYTYEESLLIKERVMKIIQQRGEVSGKYPHFLHDQTKLKADELKEASQRYGELIITAVSTDAASAIERAYARGKQTTRYEHTEGLLGSHQAVPGELIKSLNQPELMGQGTMSVVMYDNNSPTRRLEMFASIDMQTKDIIVYNDECMQKWIKKENINPKAQSEADLYVDRPVRNTEEYFGPLIVQGFKLDIRPVVDIALTIGGTDFKL